MVIPYVYTTMSRPRPLIVSVQPPGSSLLKPHPPTVWSHVWQLSVRVAGLMCHALSHLCLPALLDFTGAHQQRITMVTHTSCSPAVSCDAFSCSPWTSWKPFTHSKLWKQLEAVPFLFSFCSDIAGRSSPPSRPSIALSLAAL